MINQLDVQAATKNSATIPSRAWYGDEDLTLNFPAGWEVFMAAPHDAPRASEQAITAAFANPIGTGRIADMARGKRSAAIVVDDLSRPTPAHVLVPHVLRELATAGVPKDEIRFVVGGGSHRPLTHNEFVKKLGADVVRDYDVHSHNFMAGNLRGLGSLPDGTPLYFDPVVADAEFKMTIGGIYPHGSVGFGGGSKLILPGVSGFATMFHFHTFYPARGQANIERTGAIPDHRDASEAAAGVLGSDMVVNVVLNGRREIAGVFVGDFIQAHRAGAHFALRTYGTVIPQNLRREADLVVVNAYPLDSDPIQTSKALWAAKYFDHAYTVAVNPAVDGICYHGLFDRIDFGRFQQQVAERTFMGDPEPKLQRRDQVILYSESFPVHDFERKFPTGILVRDRERVIGLLSDVLPERAKVVVFPCSGIQVLAA